MELPYINGKTIKAILTIGCDGSTDEVRIIFTDGSTLVFTGEYIKLRLEPASEPPSSAIVTARSDWPGE